jgi:hypothetical protein
MASHKQEAYAMRALNPILCDSKVVFARNIQGFYVSEGCAVFNAPRPLLGATHSCTDWCHGRHYAEVNLSDSYAKAFIQKNNDLDACVVIAVTDAEVVEMLLVDNKRADDYREFAFEDQLEMLVPQLHKIQNLAYGDAVALLGAVRSFLTTDSSFAADNVCLAG